MTRQYWAVMWRSENRLDGKRQNLVHNRNRVPVLFATRREAREFINSEYEYIKKRPDLMAEPHGWKMPIPIRVPVEAERGRR